MSLLCIFLDEEILCDSEEDARFLPMRQVDTRVETSRTSFSLSISLSMPLGIRHHLHRCPYTLSRVSPTGLKIQSQVVPSIYFTVLP